MVNLGLDVPDVPEDPAIVKQIADSYKGRLVAWDPVQQKAVWSQEYRTIYNGGTLSTAGNLVFQGTADGRVVAYAPEGSEPPVPPDDLLEGDSISAGNDAEGDDLEFTGEDAGKKRIKYVIDSIPIYVIAERVQYYGPDGRLITESLHDYTRACVHKQFTSLDDFLRRWSDAEQKKAIIDEMAAQGVMWEALAEEVEKKQGKPLDPFDLICHVAFDQPPLSRKERAEQVKKRNYFARYSGAARQVLEALLDKYADTGIEHIEDIKILQLDPFSQLGAPMELVNAFGGKVGYSKAIHELEDELYAS